MVSSLDLTGPLPTSGSRLNEREFEMFLPKKLRSAIWSLNAFQKVRTRDGGRECKGYAVCSKCLKVFETKDGNTSTLARHIDVCDANDKCPSVMRFIKDPLPLPSDQRAKLHEACVDLIVSQSLPFTVAESESFKKIIQLASDFGAINGRPLNAEKSLPSARTVSDLIDKRHAEVRTEVKDRLKAQSRPLQV